MEHIARSIISKTWRWSAGSRLLLVRTVRAPRADFGLAKALRRLGMREAGLERAAGLARTGDERQDTGTRVPRRPICTRVSELRQSGSATPIESGGAGVNAGSPPGGRATGRFDAA